MSIKSNDVVYICGRRRSGKSYLMLHKFWKPLKRVVLHDYKREHSALGLVCHSPADVERAWKRRRTKIVYQPNAMNEEEDFQELCRLIFNRGNMTLLVDEGTVTGNSYSSTWFMKLVRMGTTRGIGVVFISQRPSGVPNSVLTEAHFFFCFTLLIEDDKRKLASFMGHKALKLDKLNRHRFLYMGEEGVATWHKPI